MDRALRDEEVEPGKGRMSAVALAKALDEDRGMIRHTGTVRQATDSSPMVFPRGACRSGRAAPPPAVGQLVAGVRRRRVAGALAGQLRELAAHVLQRPPDRDREDALTTPDQVDHLVVRGALVDGRAVADEGQVGEVRHSPGPQMVDGGPDVLQRHPGFQQLADDPQDQHVAERVEALAAGPARPAHAGHDQARARPVVKLAVGDAGRRAGRRPAVSDVVTGRLRDLVAEELTLLDHGRPLGIHPGGIGFLRRHPRGCSDRGATIHQSHPPDSPGASRPAR
ncbi:hypothetical protein FRAHR75_520021 [Frankia sp. Hr75.2]|nr:hypothetical protein FRAHR75_520021 [Frankia sp. Hr75.2]